MSIDMTTISESIQMYLVNIIRLSEDGQPVPLSLLAETLSFSPVSVHEMCRKLQEQAFVVYRPYKGVSLTAEGERIACYILRRHRLWEVFLVDKLGFMYDEAHEVACALEHATPDILTDRLDTFLGFPTVNSAGQPIPGADGQTPSRPITTLPKLSLGQLGYVNRIELDDISQAFLEDSGIRTGTWLQLLAISGDSVLIQAGEKHLSLAQKLADGIFVELPFPNEERTNLSLQISRAGDDEKLANSGSKYDEESIKMIKEKMTKIKQVALNTLSIGQRGVIVSVGGKGAIKRRMVDMGLVPGSEIIVKRVAPLGDPIEFSVKGYSLSLRKSEAKEVMVEVTDEGKL